MSAIKSSGVVKSSADETYGVGETILRIGNGGAGAVGLIAALANDYLSTLERNASITWVCNHSRNSQLALLKGFVDIALTYERDQEQISINEGWAASAGCIFHDHFCLAGPINDPAGVTNAVDLGDAFSRIACTKSLFLSRADSSATMIKERSIWETLGLKPWQTDESNSWYIKTLYSPGEAVETASKEGTYLLTDRSTLLSRTLNGSVESMTVFIEPTSSDSVLMNSCFALYDPFAQPERRKDVTAFLDHTLSERGQHIISSFGAAEAGVPLFARVASGHARDSIVGGCPIQRQWQI